MKLAQYDYIYMYYQYKKIINKSSWKSSKRNMRGVKENFNRKFENKFEEIYQKVEKRQRWKKEEMKIQDN